jgi:ferredoxin
MFGAFLGASRLNFFEWLNAATGRGKTPEKYMKIGKRIQTLKQVFNIDHGIDPWALKVGERAIGNPPLAEGPNEGRKVPLDQMMKDYWAEMGWDPQTGKPTLATLKELGILELVERQCGVCGKIYPQQAALDSTGNRAKPTAGSKPVFDKEACVSCNMCIQVCPVSCLSLSEASVKAPHRHPYMKNPALCIACGFCAEDCPVDAIRMEVDRSSKERS